MNARTNIQIINGPDGKPAFVVIPYAEYRKQAQADTIPHDVIKRIHVDGMTPARAWREHLGLTQEEAANRIGISQSAYAQQEASPKNRKSTREKIAEAFGISADMLDI